MAKVKINKSINDMINDSTYSHYESYLSLIAKSLFEWSGLPSSVNEKYLEYCLFNFGKAVFFEDDKLGTLCLKADPTNKFNIYREPIGVHATGENGYNKELKDGEFVLIRNNDDEIPTRFSIEMFAYRLYDAQRTADTNIFLHKIPYIVLCEDKELLSMKKLFEKVKANEPVIYGVKNGGLLENVKIIETKVPYIANDIMDYKNIIWNEAMTFLGIQNANMDKKERLITNEVDANNEQIAFSGATMLKARQQACEEINKMFPDYEVSVRMRSLEEIMFILDGGDNNVSNDEHNNNTENIA